MDSLQTVAWRAPLLMAGVGLSAFTSGTIASFSLVTIPAILSSSISAGPSANTISNASLLSSWRHTLLHGVRVAPPLALTATLVHFFNAYLNRNAPFNSAKFSAAAAVSTIAIVPFTVLVLQPTNQALFEREKAARGGAGKVEGSSVELVRKWGRINLVRACLPAVGAVLACFTL